MGILSVVTRRYVLNTPILTAYGVFAFAPLTVDEAILFLRTPGWTSGIGHIGTAQLLTQLSGVQVPVNRVTLEMNPGDQALVFRLKRRQQEGRELTLDDVRSIPHEYGVLERIE